MWLTFRFFFLFLLWSLLRSQTQPWLSLGCLGLAARLSLQPLQVQRLQIQLGGALGLPPGLFCQWLGLGLCRAGG